ncbi:probable nucleoside diphosphate kinase 5 isoform X1 [Ananas comosus]|uniref:Nucleoside diphosphate kinase n=2 Tax=Ananas comosus TaxID=4615 RepID=A0A6P5GQU1_ANACO|nr:probable nucleoside diphosphate kinase 5 isoform X1 [Ananas comosus]
MGRIWASQSALLLRDFLLIFLLFFGSQICDATERERTLAMIKPDGLLGNYTDKIKTIILESGFGIIKERMVQLDDEKAALFYAEHSGKSFFQSLVKYMTSGPVYVMVLEKPDAVSRWRALIGPTDARKAKVSHPSSIRAMCGSDLERNCVHGSDSPQSAAREISFFFGDISPAVDRQSICHPSLLSFKTTLSAVTKHDEL